MNEAKEIRALTAEITEIIADDPKIRDKVFSLLTDIDDLAEELNDNYEELHKALGSIYIWR